MSDEIAITAVKHLARMRRDELLLLDEKVRSGEHELAYLAEERARAANQLGQCVAFLTQSGVSDAEVEMARAAIAKVSEDKTS
jgi:hypothetical protein